MARTGAGTVHVRHLRHELQSHLYRKAQIMDPRRCKSPIKVAVLHPDTYVAAGVASLLAQRGEFLVPVDIQVADVIVADYASGLQRASLPRPVHVGLYAPAILVLTDHEKSWEIRRAVDMGVHGYLLQSCTPAELEDAVVTVAQGRRFLSRSAAERLLDSLTQTSPTARELEVLEWMARGLGNKEIGRMLGIGEGTVKTHVKAILTKLGEPTRTGAIAEALRRGLVVDEDRDVSILFAS